MSELVLLGQRGRTAQVSEFQGKPLFHLREYFYCGPNQELKATKRGTTLNYNEFTKLRKAMLYFEEEFKKLEKKGLKLSKNSDRYQPYLKGGRRQIKEDSEKNNDEINYAAAEQFVYNYQQGQAMQHEEWNSKEDNKEVGGEYTESYNLH